MSINDRLLDQKALQGLYTRKPPLLSCPCQNQRRPRIRNKDNDQKGPRIGNKDIDSVTTLGARILS